MSLNCIFHAPAWLAKHARRFGLTSPLGFSQAPYELSVSLAQAETLLKPSRDQSPRVKPGSRVVILDEQSNEKVSFVLVPPEQSKPESGKLSFLSLLGSQLLGARLGQRVGVDILGRSLFFRVIKIDIEH